MIKKFYNSILFFQLILLSGVVFSYLFVFPSQAEAGNLLGRIWKKHAVANPPAGCLYDWYILGDNCSTLTACQGAPNYTISWTQGSITESMNNNNCWTDADGNGYSHPRYTFEWNGSGPWGDADGNQVTVRAQTTGDAYKLTHWERRTTYSNGVECKPSEGGTFSTPGNDKTITINFYIDGDCKWNQLGFWTDYQAPTSTTTASNTTRISGESVTFTSNASDTNGDLSTGSIYITKRKNTVSLPVSSSSTCGSNGSSCAELPPDCPSAECTSSNWNSACTVYSGGNPSYWCRLKAASLSGSSGSVTSSSFTINSTGTYIAQPGIVDQNGKQCSGSPFIVYPYSGWDYCGGYASVTVSCSPSNGNGCNRNNCGGGTGTTQCDGSCSATAPADVTGIGNTCTLTSSANNCSATATSNGTLACNAAGTGSYCSGTTPSAPADVTGIGNTCTLTSSANNCGAVNTASGSLACNAAGTGSYCSGTTPSAPADVANIGVACALTSAANSCGDTNTTNGTVACNTAGTGSVCNASAPTTPSERTGYNTSCTVYSAYNACGQRASATGTNNVCLGGANSGQGVGCSAAVPAVPVCTLPSVSSLRVKEDTTVSPPGVALGTYGRSGLRSTGIEGGGNYYNTLEITPRLNSGITNNNNIGLVGAAFIPSSVTTTPTNLAGFISRVGSNGFVVLRSNCNCTIAGKTFSSGAFYAYYNGQWRDLLTSNNYKFDDTKITIEANSSFLSIIEPRFKVTFKKSLGSLTWKTYKYIATYNYDSNNNLSTTPVETVNLSTPVSSSLPLSSSKGVMDILASYFNNLLPKFH